ncbi:MAG: patatin-like phospholipase family protein [Endomicrobia bacterium]|nr:patatin-like phospholipase family protein [Endomicrobiia bacterium]
MKTLLSIDGGGLFGVGVANWVPKLDNWKFDYYAGTSVGAILAACYASGKKPSEVQDLFNGDLPKKMFTKPGFPQNLNPLRPYVYGNKEAKKILKGVFGDTKVKDTEFPLVIVAWNYEKRKEKVFTRKFNGDYLLRDAVLASMSAPYYFPAALIKDENSKEEKLGDGGVCGNDPSLAGIAAMRDDGIIVKNIKCLSVGTTGTPKEKKLNVSASIGWLSVITDVITVGNAEYTSYGISRLLEHNNRYLRVAPDNLPSGSMDDFNLLAKIKKVWSEWDHLKALSFLKGNTKAETKP